MTGEQLVFLRQFLNIPKKQMAEIMGIIPRHLQYYESGKFKVSKKHDQLLKNGLFGKKWGQKSVENREVTFSKNTKNSTPRPATSGLESCLDCQKGKCQYSLYLHTLLTNYLDYVTPKVDKSTVELIETLRGNNKGQVINIMKDIEERMIAIKQGQINKTGIYTWCNRRNQKIDTVLCKGCEDYQGDKCVFKTKTERLFKTRRGERRAA